MNNASDDNFKIVVVDDNKFIRGTTVNLIRNVLTNLNIIDIEILEASDGIDLLNMVRLDKSFKIKVIFIDENMEYMNGSEAVRLIRKMEDNNKIKNYNIVSITALEDNDSRDRILSSGVNTIISKPCGKSDISKIISKIVIA